jgi:hypothetical protein
VLDRIATLARARQIAVQPEGLPDGLQRLLALATAVPETSAARAATSRSWLARVGAAAQDAWDGTREATRFLGEATLSFGRFLRGTAIFQWRDVLRVLQESGPDALPIVTLINFLSRSDHRLRGRRQLQKARQHLRGRPGQHRYRTRAGADHDGDHHGRAHRLRLPRSSAPCR